MAGTGTGVRPVHAHARSSSIVADANDPLYLGGAAVSPGCATRGEVHTKARASMPSPSLLSAGCALSFFASLFVGVPSASSGRRLHTRVENKQVGPTTIKGLLEAVTKRHDDLLLCAYRKWGARSPLSGSGQSVWKEARTAITCTLAPCRPLQCS